MSSSSARAPPRSFRASRWRMYSSSSVRAPSRSSRASGLRTCSSSSVRAPFRSFRANRQSHPALADRPYQPLPQIPWPTPLDGDPKRRAAEVSVASRAQEGLARAAGRVRMESRRPGSNRAHPARSPAARPGTARTRNDRSVATSERAVLSDPLGQRIRRRPSFRCPSAQRPFTIREQRTDETFRKWRSVTSYATGPIC